MLGSGCRMFVYGFFFHPSSFILHPFLPRPNRFVEIPFDQIPFARPIPHRPHAVSCSFPTMENIVQYEERLPEVVARLKVAYPRFVSHHWVLQWEACLQSRHQLRDRAVFCLCSPHAARALQQYVGSGHVRIFADDTRAVVSVVPGGEAEEKARKFLQHTGVRISSREAEDLLLRDGLIPGAAPEQPSSNPSVTVRNALCDTIGSTSREDVWLATSGMSSVFAAFSAIRDLQAAQSRTLWIQLGWLYVDTYEILNKFAGEGDRRILIPDPTDLDQLAALLDERGREVAGIIAELPTNPLVQTPDAGRLLELSRLHEVVLMVDPTVSSIFNVDTMPYCDVFVTSLTKYIAHEGDVMMGLLALNPQSPFYPELKTIVPQYVEPPYHRDVARVAEQLPHCRTVARAVNANTLKLARYLQQHPGVKKVHWAYGETNRERYGKIERSDLSPGCMITVDLVKPLAEVYDPCRISKGPSFGMSRTLICPYMYMAHYDIVSDPGGRKDLAVYGINPDLLRISVGVEPIEQIIDAFDEVL